MSIILPIPRHGDCVQLSGSRASAPEIRDKSESPDCLPQTRVISRTCGLSQSDLETGILVPNPVKTTCPFVFAMNIAISTILHTFRSNEHSIVYYTRLVKGRYVAQ